jgi:tRNA G18 (ribose-2'-O)-methylase SpoU
MTASAPAASAARMMVPRLPGVGLRVVAADVEGADFLASRDLLSEPTAWLFGNEARGLEDDLDRIVTRRK